MHRMHFEQEVFLVDAMFGRGMQASNYASKCQVAPE